MVLEAPFTLVLAVELLLPALQQFRLQALVVRVTSVVAVLFLRPAAVTVHPRARPAVTAFAPRFLKLRMLFNHAPVA
jgi:hypothetical protein